MKTLERPAVASNGARFAVRAPKKRGRLWLFLVAAALVLAAAAAVVFRIRAANHIDYFTATVVRKGLVQTVTASGTLNPQNTILVGTQDSGTITEQDADYNSVVKKGQILTRIDPTNFQAALSSAQSSENEADAALAASEASAAAAEQNVLAARAAVASAQSQLGKSKAALDLANVTLRRDHALLVPGYLAQQQYDSDVSAAAAARSAYEAAVITVPQAEAQLRASLYQARGLQATAAASRSAIDVQRAAVESARYNLHNTIIRAQVNGTIIARNISIGQTVAASFQTPTLFTMGQDLTKMQVDVAVGEPDIGGVRSGDFTDFTVLAYPNRTFHGTVYQVRQNPTTVNNVVTYDTVVYVDNKDGALYPGMTANASIHVAKVTDAIVVPIAALQYAPPQSQRPVSNAQTPASPWGITEASLTRTIIAGRKGRLFTLRDGNLVRVPVRVLLVGGTEAAVEPIGAALAAGDRVVISDSKSMMASQHGSTGSALTQRPATGGSQR
jgi:HlyD family secretion protein